MNHLFLLNNTLVMKCFFLNRSVAVSKPFGRHMSRRSIRIIIFILNIIIPLLHSLLFRSKLVPFEIDTVCCTSIFGIVVKFRERKKRVHQTKNQTCSKNLFVTDVSTNLKKSDPFIAWLLNIYVFHRQKENGRRKEEEVFPPKIHWVNVE